MGEEEWRRSSGETWLEIWGHRGESLGNCRPELGAPWSESQGLCGWGPAWGRLGTRQIRPAER